jgi:outer membrane protein assembly factor BamA
MVIKINILKFTSILYVLLVFTSLRSTAKEIGEDPSSNYLHITDIIIEGNKKTKKVIILRELGFTNGDSVLKSEIDILLLKAKQQLINTSLFLTVSITSNNPNTANIQVIISVKERWYLFPSPVFSLADKNLNLWWSQQQRSLQRVNYGLALDYKNFTGNNDNLDIGFQVGYNPSWGIYYGRPNIGKKQQHEIGIQFINGKSREVNYATMFDRKSFFKLDGFIRKHTEGRLSYIYRKNIFTRHFFALGFMKEYVQDTVAKINPAYLSDGINKMLYPEFIYRFSFNNTNNLLYPLKGKQFIAEVLRSGTGKKNQINSWQLKLEMGTYYKVLNKTFFSTNIFTKLVYAPRQSFLALRSLGYSDKELFRGLDKYVLDGSATGLIKNNIRREVSSGKIKARFLPSSFSTIPFQIYIKALYDVGYVHNNNTSNNTLLNKLLVSKGIGVDIVSFYDMNINFEYTFNQLMENGLFFRLKFGLQ